MQKKKRWITVGILTLAIGFIIGASFFYAAYIYDILEMKQMPMRRSLRSRV